MKPGLRSIALTVVLALIAAAAGAWLCAHYVVHEQTHRSSLHEMVHKDLRLSSDQKVKLDAIEATFAVRRKALETELRSANRELAAAMMESHRNSPRVQAAVDHIHHSMGELQKETIAHVFAMRAVLTPEQAKKFDAELVEALTDEDR
jgi:Spy/CpxP family protein refolding chaperone